MNTDTLLFENDDQRRRAVAWVVALTSTIPLTGPPDASPPRVGLGANGVYQVLYRSTATKLFTNQELLDLLEFARRFNMDNHITGLLLYSEGKFVQAIEGQEDVITSLYGRIRQDTRHHEVETVSEGLLPARRFPEWSMDFGYAADPEDGAGPQQALPGLSTTKAHLQRLLEIFIG